MPRVHFRQVPAQLSDIDARYDGCRLEFSQHAFYRVRLKPWWEHPWYVAARAKKHPFGYRATGENEHLMTMFPIGLRHFRITRRRDFVRWAFVESGPPVWPFEPHGQIFVNDRVAADALVDAVACRLAVSRMELATMYVTAATWASKPPYSLQLPASIHDAAVAALDELGVDHLVAQRPPVVRLPVILRLDGIGEIVADDFEVDVPDFGCRDEALEAR